MKYTHDLIARKSERLAKIRAGLDGYTGHLSKADIKSRLEVYHNTLRALDNEIARKGAKQ